MSRNTVGVLLAVVVSTGLAVGCSHSTSSGPESTAAPVSPSSVPANPTTQANPPSAAAAGGQLERQVTMQDACDPTTFDAVIGAGACVRSGGMTFQKFIDELTKHAAVGAWHFAPPITTAKVGQTFVAINRGGEEHTFTEVKEYGGGIVPDLNTLAHVPVVAPECAALEEDDFVKPGATYREEIGEAGTVKFQCCIHPWMRLEARVSEK
jgi:plastocyanin